MDNFLIKKPKILQNGQFSDKEAEDTPIPKTEVSLLNKILNKEINDMYEGKVEIRTLQADPSSPLHSTETFESLRLKPELIAACYAKGFQLPSKIQSACIPLILKTPAPDLVAQAQNGTGKTATFLLSVLQRIDTSINAPQSIIIAPTLELAQQIVTVAKDLSIKMPDLRIRCATKGEIVTPGTVFNDHIIIGSPGIAERWIVQHRAIDISKVFCIIFDEADDMLSMQNVQDNIFRILNYVKTSQPNCQLLFFSATYDDDAIRYLVEPFAPDAQYIT
uniref:ATP-dependent RNA helicase n=1 Tax=Panagrolaimus sp. PS1159 TaxID=55785 RepID=A0AC35GHJ8_9BILA